MRRFSIGWGVPEAADTSSATMFDLDRIVEHILADGCFRSNFAFTSDRRDRAAEPKRRRCAICAVFTDLYTGAGDEPREFLLSRFI